MRKRDAGYVLSRVWAILAGGGLLAFLASTILALFGLSSFAWFIGCWILAGLWLARAQAPWSGVWLALAVGCFAFPVVTFVLGMSATDASTTEGAAVGAAASLALAGVAGFFGFFGGIVFALLAFFTRRRAPA